MPEDKETFYNPNTKRRETRKVQKGESFDKEKYQGFSAGGKVAPDDPTAPKRSDFPEGLGGTAAYDKAMKAHKAKHQSDAIKER